MRDEHLKIWLVAARKAEKEETVEGGGEDGVYVAYGGVQMGEGG